MKYDELQLTVNAPQRHLELAVDGHVVFIQYKISHRNLFLIHTEVPVAMRGKGLGTAIVEKSLQYAKDNNYKVVPLCHFVQAYIKAHPAWHAIVAENARRYIQ